MLLSRQGGGSVPYWKVKFALEEAMKAQRLDGVGWLTPRPGRFTSGNDPVPVVYRRLSEPQGRSGRVRKISHPLGLDLRTVQAVGSRYTEWAIQAHIYLNTARYNWDFYWLLQRSAKFLLRITGVFESVFFFLTLTRYVQDRRVFYPLSLDTFCLLAYRTDRQLQSTRMLQ